MKKILIVLSIVLVLMVGCIQTPPQQTPPANGTHACTTEAKICPDGTAVGRTGPNCEFAPCPQIVGNDTDLHGCIGSAGYAWCEVRSACVREWETPCRMEPSDALLIARNSTVCTEMGNISDVDPVYNNNSKTWWFGIQMSRPGCSPACVVYENRSAELNWRCTGALIYTAKVANSTLGPILVDDNGYTLYTFTADTGGVSTCYGSCAVNWPPVLIVDTISIPSGLHGTFGAFMRTDNYTQVTYNGKPLYTYAADHSPGDTNGQGVGGKWYVVHPS